MPSAIDRFRHERVDGPAKLISDEFTVEGGMHYVGLLTSVFSPLIYSALPPLVINSVPVAKFKKHLKITSNILDPVDDMLAQGMKFFLAGGKLIDFVNNLSLEESTNDYDLWFNTDQDAWDTVEELKKQMTNSAEFIQKGHVSECLHPKYGKKLQLVMKAYDGPEDVLSSFDFRTCAIAYDGENIYWVKGCLHDIKEKNLVVVNVRSNRGTYLRVRKYMDKGYNIQAPDFALVSLSCLLSLNNNNHNTVDYFLNRRVGLEQRQDQIFGLDLEGYGEI